jgi:hypothetical protein
MQPMQALEPCKDREMLKGRLRADLKIYTECVARLNVNLGADFEKTRERAESARLAFEGARDLLSKHVASHGCE